MATQSVQDLYNSLPSLEGADEKFNNREHIFPLLAAVLKGYEDKFAINLVHGHCKLKEGEKMVTNGTITQPTRNAECFPERWLATGQAFVFNTKPTESPPDDLLRRLRTVVDTVGHINGIPVLAISYLRNLPPTPLGEVYTESTEGRADIMTSGQKNENEMIWTCWSVIHRTMFPLYGCIKSHGGQHSITFHSSV